MLKGRVKASIVSEPAAKVAGTMVASQPVSSRPTPAVVETESVRDSVAAGAELVE